LIQNSQFSIKPFESGLVIVMGKTKCNKWEYNDLCNDMILSILKRMN
jgi:hypothetical protein